MRAWLKINFLILIFLTVSRFLFFITLYRLFDGAFADLPLSFLTGIRFDLMVLGFLNIPMVFLLGLSWFNKFWNYYFLFFLWIMVILTSADWAYFDQNLDRINKLLIMPEMNLKYVFASLLFSITAILISRRILKTQWQKKPLNWKQVLTAIFVVALCTRGSLGPHHLDLRHSEISENKFINILSINSPYAWDQALRGRR